MRFLLVIATALGLLACDGSENSITGWKPAPHTGWEQAPHTGSKSAPHTGSKSAPHTGSKPAPQNAEFVVHEWGTYTSVQGSNGVELPGMHHEEESLPAFVYGRGALPEEGPQVKQLEVVPENVTQKLETPVLYFYGADAMQVEVTVDFPEGVISQWYPDASSFAPEVGAMRDIERGSMTWNFETTSSSEGLISVPPDDIWAPSRQVSADAIRVGNEVEKFIFYRGLGRFSTPFSVTSDGGGIRVHNESGDDIPAVFVMKYDGSRGMFHSLGALEGGESIDFAPTPKELPTREYFESARGSLVDALVESGLYEDEALAMVNTWNRSYFEKPGLRVLYVAPRAWTDELLPIRVEPRPDELVRTLIGRVEVVTADQEQALLGALEEAIAANQAPDVESLGRFAEPKLHRIIELTDDQQVTAACVEAISRIQP